MVCVPEGVRYIVHPFACKKTKIWRGRDRTTTRRSTKNLAHCVRVRRHTARTRQIIYYTIKFYLVTMNGIILFLFFQLNKGKPEKSTSFERYILQCLQTKKMKMIDFELVIKNIKILQVYYDDPYNMQYKYTYYIISIKLKEIKLYLKSKYSCKSIKFHDGGGG